MINQFLTKLKWAIQICPFYLSILFLLSNSVQAQEELPDGVFLLQGRVKSFSDSTGIPYAHVYLSEKFTGTVANESGQFELKIPQKDIEIDVLFSAIGYKTKSINLNNGSFSSIEIFLEEVTYQLPEVIVSATSFDSASYIFDRAVQNIKLNCPRKPHLMEGFFRELSLKDTIYTRLIEAAVVVQEDGYNKQYFQNRSLEETKSRIKVLELRKSDDFREYDFWNKMLTRFLGERNELYMIFRNNYVRSFDTKVKNYLVSYDNVKKFDMDYVGRSEWEGKPIYVISVTIPQAFRDEKITFFINQSDFAFVKIEHIGVPSESWRANRSFSTSQLIEGKYYDKSEITYRKVSSKYYPIFIHTTWSAYGASSTVESDGKTLKQYTDVLFLLSNVYEDDYSRIKWKNAEKQDKDLYQNNAPYNEKFWENYNAVKLNPLKRDAVELEKKRALAEQFKKSQN